MKFITKLIKLPSFSEHANPDWSFSIAGLKIGGYSEGVPIYAINHISISHQHDATVSSVPEPSVALMFAVGLIVVLLKRRLS